jgi:hypothetical protein
VRDERTLNRFAVHGTVAPVVELVVPRKLVLSAFAQALAVDRQGEARPFPIRDRWTAPPGLGGSGPRRASKAAAIGGWPV